MIKYGLLILMISGLCTAFYFLGRSHSEIKIIREKGEEIVKEVEVIKYVEKEKAKIWSKPNDSRDVLLKRMSEGKL